MVMQNMACGTGDAALREWLPRLWRRIEDAHYSYLETDDSPEKLHQKKKLEDYIMEYLSRAPHQCKFRLTETSKVFNRTVHELPEFNAHRAGLGWAAVARYAAHLLNQPWRKEYRLLRLYSGFYKHEVEANIVGAETLLHAMGYTAAGAGRLALLAPVCPDTVAAVSRDALVAHCECQIMLQVWEALWNSGANVSHITWADILRERATRPARPGATAAALLARSHELPYIDNGSEIYSNIPTTVTENNRIDRYNQNQCQHCPDDSPIEEPSIIHPYMVPPNLVPQYMYPLHPDMPQCSNVPMMTSYVPYYYPVQAPYMIPTPVYPSIKHAATVAVNGYPPQYRYPAVPTGQLIELDAVSVYENEDIRHKKRPESSRRNSTSKSAFSDVTLPSLPRSDTQPTLSKAREDGMGTYESWDYVFRNLSSKDGGRSGYSPSLDRDSRTLDRLEKPHRSRFQPTTLDLEDGLQALTLDHRVEELKKDLKKTKQVTKKISVEEKPRPKRQIETVANPKSDALITPKIAPDKVKLLTKKDIRDRKDVIKQQSSVNGSVSNAAEVKKVRKPTRLVASDAEKHRPMENGTSAHSSKNNVSNAKPNYDLKAQLIVSLDETDSRRSPPRPLPNGERPASAGRPSRDLQGAGGRWTCGTCTYLNKEAVAACEMCGKSQRGPEIQPLTSGGRECPACTLVNQREARVCDACGTSLDHCPTYI